jgi:hypothetical protein
LQADGHEELRIAAIAFRTQDVKVRLRIHE